MPRKPTSRLTKSALTDLEKRGRRAFIELNTIAIQLEEWRGSTEKVDRWGDDIAKSVDKLEDVLASMRLVLRGQQHEALDDYDYSFRSE